MRPRELARRPGWDEKLRAVSEVRPEATHVMFQRAVAHFADGLLYTLLIAALLVAAALISNVLLVVALILAFPGQVAYYVLTQRRTGQSPGKKLVGIRVIDESGGVPSTGALVRRTLPLLLEYFYVIALFAMWSSPQRQRLGDRWAHTYVVRDLPADGQPDAAAQGITQPA